MDVSENVKPIVNILSFPGEVVLKALKIDDDDGMKKLGVGVGIWVALLVMFSKGR